MSKVIICMIGLIIVQLFAIIMSAICHKVPDDLERILFNGTLVFLAGILVLGVWGMVEELLK